MNINLQAVKFTLDEDQKTFVHKKFERIKYAEDLIVDVLCTIKFDKKFTYECTVNFKGGTAHVSTEDYDFKAGVNKLMDVLDQKVRKEPWLLNNTCVLDRLGKRSLFPPDAHFLPKALL